MDAAFMWRHFEITTINSSGLNGWVAGWLVGSPTWWPGRRIMRTQCFISGWMLFCNRYVYYMFTWAACSDQPNPRTIINRTWGHDDDDDDGRIYAKSCVCKEGSVHPEYHRHSLRRAADECPQRVN